MAPAWATRSNGFPTAAASPPGLTALGFGAGSALTVLPISTMIKSIGYQTAFLCFGIGQGIVVMLIGWLPTSGASAAGSQTAGAAKRALIQTHATTRR